MTIKIEIVTVALPLLESSKLVSYKITLKDCSQCIMTFLLVYLIFNKPNIIRTKLSEHECLAFTISHDYFVRTNITLPSKNNHLTSKTATYVIFKCIHLCS